MQFVCRYSARFPILLLCDERNIIDERDLGGGAGMGRGSLPFSRGAAHAGPFRGRGAHQVGGAGHTAMASDSSAPSRYGEYSKVYISLKRIS